MMAFAFTRIAIAEPSDIVFEGLTNCLLKQESHLQFFRIDEPSEIVTLMQDVSIDVAIINPSLVIVKDKTIRNLRRSFPSLKLVALVYSHFAKDIIESFHDTISIFDKPLNISLTLVKIEENELQSPISPKEQLSERETEVLIHLVSGMSNKEIADVLNISFHTVVSHRKNISHKTGIKSESGLTIYALTNKIIPFSRES
jgi:DNA-binding NarL/FixJ family response regulator